MITVSPFTGELDICPRDCPAIFYCFQIFNGSIQISVENLCRISYALFPPSTMVSQPGPLPFALITRWHGLPREVGGVTIPGGVQGKDRCGTEGRRQWRWWDELGLDWIISAVFSDLNDSMILAGL